MRDCLKHAAKEIVGSFSSKRRKKEWVSQQMREKMKERRKCKNVKREEGKKMYRRLNNELRSETEKVRENWLKDKCEEIESLESCLLYTSIRYCALPK